MIHAKIFAGLQKDLEAKYEISSTIRHKGERGRSRETGVAGFLKENLPVAFGVGTGEVFSFNTQGISPQCDIVIYDSMRTPIFGKDKAVQQIPIEGVFAIVEVRSILDVGALKAAAAKFQAIRDLWSAAKPNNASPTWDADGPEFFLFGFKLKTTTNSCLRSLRDSAALEPAVIALDSGCSIWVGSKPSRPIWLTTTDPAIGMYATLAFFYFGVLDACQAEPRRLNFKDIMSSCL